MADQYLEPSQTLDAHTLECTRAIKTLTEELEAVMFYQQRVSVCKDPALRAIMAHNRDEEIEHAAMALEWLRRNMDGFDKELRTYLFTEGDLTHMEGAGGETSEESSSGGSLGIGSMK